MAVGLRSHGQLRVLLLLLQPAEVIGGFMEEEAAEEGSTGVSQERRVTSLDLLDKLDMGARCPLAPCARTVERRHGFASRAGDRAEVQDLL